MTQRLRRIGPRVAAVLVLAIAAAFFLPATGQARERIVSFDADITVRPDTTVLVRETITVISERRVIRRGIFRDFPTDYRTHRGERVRVGFEVLSVTRNGRREPYHTEKRSNGVRFYIGNKDRLIRPGRHVYVLTYRTNRQLGYFDGYDEFYWNVTGLEWAFPIERASALIHLPIGARVTAHAAYTGPKGATGKDFAYAPRDDESAYFSTTRTLAPHEGLTVAVSWPPGFVTRPSSSQQAAWFVTDNAVLLAGLLGLVMVLIYFVPVWVMVGRDPEKSTIVPHYAPPKGFSPAAARYVQRMGFDDKTFTAAVVSMAVKGFLTIEERGSRTYRLEKTGRRVDDLSMGEKAVARKLFAGGRNGIDLKQTNHKTLSKAKKGLQAWLRSEFEKTYFLRNTIYFLPGLGLSAIAMVILVLATDEAEGAAFMVIWLSIWSVAVYFLVRMAWRGWQAVFNGGGIGGIIGGGIQAIMMTVMAAAFVFFEGGALWMFQQLASVEAAAVLGLLIFLNFLFYHLLKAPTLLGRRVMDQIEGFADYLSVAEKDRMNFHNPPERTPELFEKFLPYALALGVEHQWSEQFAGVLAQAGTPDGTGRRAYHPHWYRGRSFSDQSFSGLASSLSASFSGAISSASTAPGSSSGSGGGGSSGGGGGGGGGGGW